MKSKVVLGIMLTSLLTGMLTLAFNIEPVKSHPKIIRVPTDYPTIQEAIDAGASPGDTICVYSGIYYENVIVNKPVSLIGEDKDTTVIDGNGSLRVVAIHSDGVSISGFTVMHSYGELGQGGGGLVVGGVENVQISDIIACDNDADWGVHLNPDSHDVNIMRTVIVNNSRGGLMLHGTWKVKVSNNIITDNAYWAGVRLQLSSNNIVSGNTITNNDYDGIDLLNASSNTISGNTITNNDYGIHLLNSSNNSVFGNTITANNWDGILLDESSKNTIYRNNITNNDEYGILLVRSGNNMVPANNANNNTYGILLYYSGNNTVWGNTANNNSLNGVLIWGSGSNTVSHNAINSNNATGMAIGFSNHNTISDNFAIFNAGDGIWLWNASHNIISGNNASNNTVHNGISLGASYNNTVINNVAHSNYHNGICLYNGTTNNQLISNILSWNNAHGIGVHESSNNNILLNNNISKNNCGIGFTNSSYNTIYHNNFINNVLQVINNGSINIWDDGYPSGGNYWSDHVCTGNPSDGSQPYNIDENNIDHYPFQDPNGWLLPPSIQACIYTDKDTYAASDIIHVGLDVYNPLEQPITVYFRIWLEMPCGYVWQVVYSLPRTLPAGFTYSNPNFRSFVLLMISKGVYTWHAAFLDPSTHEIIVEDTAQWQFQ